ncbi:hypothetical protein IWQ62_001481 [Dispira parvispora]|uniref:CBS domain-containing protein n=1 Tax=Dispira parvispora TaxID=1520584 RepID=A0A9W8AXV9_9FUNG|nr:hypothetical protein IWQ62_001481 [Dispira parvispora]
MSDPTIPPSILCPPVLSSVAAAIGNTPLVTLTPPTELKLPSSLELLAKLEYLNPGGSVSDRVAQYVLPRLPRCDVGQSTTTLVVPSSGNFAISLATLATPRGYKLTAVIPERTTQDRIALLKALDVEIVRTVDNALPEAPESCFSVARQIASEIPGAVLVDIFSGRDYSMEECYRTMGEEILAQCQGKLDVLIVGVESGCTITGLAKNLKRTLPQLRVVGVEPNHSFISQGLEGTGQSALIRHTWKVEDLGQHAPPGALDPNCVDFWCHVTDQISFSMARRLVRSGLLVGTSSGGVVAAAHTYARTSMQPGERAVVILNDTARNYTSTLLSDEWLLDNDLMDDSLARKLQHNLVNKYRGATVEDLQLPEAVTISPRDTVSKALDIMESREYSQLPVINSTHRKLVGYITLGTLQALLLTDRVTLDQPIREVMYRFQPLAAQRSSAANDHPSRLNAARRPTYQVITPDTPLNELAKFFEHHSVAFVTDSARKFCLGVVTKFDLLKFISRRRSALDNTLVLS